ncbi:hypothetical protein MM213_09825 [Belliella sp. R4-6]|uniref:TIGR02646 family protein n=1 Tax=Belliella alkalica TaxID=1730871 RepID=A0ABS9VBH1_9BACT|nr:hypothetical protein [Belliella alkalica]MCH7413782.1 hypothetical protein [Belliella alkalica]
MIRIDKSGVSVPSILASDGLLEKSKFQTDFDSNPSGYLALSPNKPVSQFNFKKEIYGGDEVKEALTDIQNGKCCFCESKMRHVSDGDIEHFRPKGRWKQANGTPIVYPGYYWKSYDWDNLFLACQKCNQREKQDVFPIESNSVRALNHHSDVNSELPTFIHPENDDPEDHIEFIDQYIKAKTTRGQVTITQLGLDRSFLDNFREERLDDLSALEDCYITSIGHPNEQKCKEIFFDRLRNYVSEGGEYSNMFKSNFSQYLIFL